MKKSKWFLISVLACFIFAFMCSSAENAPNTLENAKTTISTQQKQYLAFTEKIAQAIDSNDPKIQHNIVTVQDNGPNMLEAGAGLKNKIKADKQLKNDPTKVDIVAYYKKDPITHADLDACKVVYANSTLADKSDASILKILLLNKVEVDEALAQGYTVTQDEIDTYVQFYQDQYQQYKDNADSINEYCEGAGITVDDYFQKIRDGAPIDLPTSKFERSFETQYVNDNPDITGDPDVAADNALQAYKEELYQKHIGDIKLNDKSIEDPNNLLGLAKA